MMSVQKPEARTAFIIAEYNALLEEIRLRLDLQHRNMNVLMVLMTAVLGYLVDFVSRHTLSSGNGSLVESETLILAPLLVLVTLVFVWRHLDHDVNIIDKAAYVNERLRPDAESLAGHEVLGFEEFLNERRRSRTKILGPLIEGGQEHIPMLLIAACFLIASWIVIFDDSSYAGTSPGVFLGLVAAGTAFFSITVAMAVLVGGSYATLADNDRGVMEWLLRRLTRGN